MAAESVAGGQRCRLLPDACSGTASGPEPLGGPEPELAFAAANVSRCLAQLIVRQRQAERGLPLVVLLALLLAGPVRAQPLRPEATRPELEPFDGPTRGQPEERA